MLIIKLLHKKLTGGIAGVLPGVGSLLSFRFPTSVGSEICYFLRYRFLFPEYRKFGMTVVKNACHFDDAGGEIFSN
jgi:hypothetical protein